eukprot:9488161-Pyramimonas_sp.AAC.1
MRVERTPASCQTLFNSKCSGPPVLGEGHFLAKWGPAAMCERCGASSPNILQFARNLLLVRPGPPSNKSTLANIRSHIKR